MLGLGLSIPAVAVRQAGGSSLAALIASLFGNGEQGGFYVPRPNVLGQQVLFQDAAGTTPVTAPGDPVGLMMDLSGNDNHAAQEVSGARPVYRTDGQYHWLEGDGVDDAMSAPVPAFGSGPRTVAASMTFLGASSRPATLTLGDNGSRRMFSALYEYAIRYSDGNQVFEEAPQVGVAETAIFGSSGDVVGNGYVYKNGLKLTEISSSNAEKPINTASGLTIFKYPPDTGGLSEAKFFGGLVVGREMTEHERQLATSLLNKFAGVTL